MQRPRSRLLCRPTPWPPKPKRTLMHRSALPACLSISLSPSMVVCVCPPSCLLASLLSARRPAYMPDYLSVSTFLLACPLVNLSVHLICLHACACVPLPASVHAMRTNPVFCIHLCVSSVCSVEHSSHSMSWQQQVEQSDGRRDVNCGHEAAWMSWWLHVFTLPVLCIMSLLPGSRTKQHSSI